MRYPGSKEQQLKHITPITETLLRLDRDTYVEPFVGGGSTLYANLVNAPMCNVVINDFSYPLYAYWDSVFNNPEELKKLIKTYNPSETDFWQWKEIIANEGWGEDKLETGFRKLVVHEISRSGLGERDFGTDLSRWDEIRLCKIVDSWNALNHNFTVLNVDFREIMSDYNTPNVVLYLDPPYWHAPFQPYTYYFTESDHYDLKELVEVSEAAWVLSYDDNPIVDSLSRTRLSMDLEYLAVRKGEVVSLVEKCVVQTFDPRVGYLTYDYAKIQDFTHGIFNTV